MVNCGQVVSAGKIRVKSHVADLVLHMIGQINFTSRQDFPAHSQEWHKWYYNLSIWSIFIKVNWSWTDLSPEK